MENDESIRFFSGLSAADLRRFKILEAMERLAVGIPFDRLTVKMICEEADVSRQTFYNNFKDKYEVGQWFWLFCAERTLLNTGRTLSWYEGNLQMLRALSSYRRFTIYVFADSLNYNSPTRFGYRERCSSLIEVIEDFTGVPIDDDLGFQVHFFVDAESRVVTNWVASGMEESPESLSRRIDLCIPPQLRAVVDEALACNASRRES